MIGCKRVDGNFNYLLFYINSNEKTDDKSQQLKSTSGIILTFFFCSPCFTEIIINYYWKAKICMKYEWKSILIKMIIDQREKSTQQIHMIIYK